MKKLSTGLMVGNKMRFSVVNTDFVIVVEKVNGDFHLSLTAVEGNTSRVLTMARWKSGNYRNAANGFFRSPEVQSVIARV